MKADKNRKSLPWNELSLGWADELHTWNYFRFSKKLFDLKEMQALPSVKQGQDQTVAKSISYMQV